MNVHFNTTLFSFLCVILITLLTHPAAPVTPSGPTLAKHAAITPENDPFARLSLEAARRYNQINLSNTSTPPRSNPILAKHKQFSKNWWDALFSTCKGCENKNEKIDCKQLLKDNPQWEEVKSMNQQSKNRITQQALEEFVYIDDACSLACSLCVGGNPDTRLDGREPHTALHLSSGNETGNGCFTKPHYGLFNLLLRQGADPNLKCVQSSPLEFRNMPDSWKKELKAHGAKLPEHDDN